MSSQEIKKLKVDTLLKVNSRIIAMTGKDSSVEELKFAQKICKANLINIKEIDPQFFERVDDGEE